MLAKRTNFFRRGFFLGVIVTTMGMACSAQQSYTVSRGIASYDTLANATSILYDVLQSPFIGSQANINFGFSFPYFGNYYDSVTLYGDGLADFAGSVEYSCFLFTGAGYENHLISGQPIHSDWRFKKDTANGLKILKAEWRNVGLEPDVISANPTYHFLNFQTWFYENGIIELHFGEIDLAATPFYSQAAFIDEDGDIFGPWMGIDNIDFSELYFVTGNNQNFSVITVDSLRDIFYDIPPPGTYYRFKPNEISSIEKEDVKAVNGFSVFPNPFNTSTTIEYALLQPAMVSLSIYDESGRLVMVAPPCMQNEGRHQNKIDFRGLECGFYLAELKTDGEVFYKKIVLSH